MGGDQKNLASKYTKVPAGSLGTFHIKVWGGRFCHSLHHIIVHNIPDNHQAFPLVIKTFDKYEGF